MGKTGILFCTLMIAAVSGEAVAKFETDMFSTSGGELKITFIGHGTLMMEFDGKIIHIDPYSRLADYAALPDADLILITHEHGDHLDLSAIEEIRTESTQIVLNPNAAERLQDGIIMNNGDDRTVAGIKIDAVPAYNLVHKRDNGQFYHPKGNGNGYVLTFGDKRVYVAGDTENIPEMKALSGIDVAFLPMNLPYTMTPEMAADAAKMISPKILYPYHYGDTDPEALTALLKNRPEIEVRIRKMR